MHCVSTYDEITGTLKYRQDLADTRILRNGRRKLAVMEFWFLTDTLESYNSHAIVVYAGAAPGRHIDFVSSYFPNVMFLLFDTTQFDIVVDLSNNTHRTRPRKHIHAYDPLTDSTSLDSIVSKARADGHRILLFQQLFTDDVARMLKGADYFWSDIRNNRYGKQKPSDADIIRDSMHQVVWTSIIRPLRFMLKFRIPFYSEQDVKDMEILAKDESIKLLTANTRDMDIDMIEDYKSKKIRYLSGTLMIQPYTRRGSAETRLVGSDINIIHTYDILEYENKMCYYSKEIRTSIAINPMFDKLHGFDGCNDCRIEARVVKAYENKYKQYIIQSWYDKCHRYTNNVDMKMNGHGERYLERPLLILEEL